MILWTTGSYKLLCLLFFFNNDSDEHWKYFSTLDYNSEQEIPAEAEVFITVRLIQ